MGLNLAEWGRAYLERTKPMLASSLGLPFFRGKVERYGALTTNLKWCRRNIGIDHD